MCCEKCKHKGDDNYCGSCSNFNGDSGMDSLFGYKVNIDKKDKSEKEKSSDSKDDSGSSDKPKKSFSLDGVKDLGSSLGGLFSGLSSKKSQPQSVPQAASPVFMPTKKEDSKTMYYVLGGLALIAVIVIIYFVARKKK